MRPPGAPSSASIAIVGFAFRGVAALLAWRTFRRPTLGLCSIALGWTLLEFVATSYPGFALSMVGIRSVVGTLAAISGLRGALSMRAFRRAAAG